MNVDIRRIRTIPASKLKTVITRAMAVLPPVIPVQATIIPGQGATPVRIIPTAKSG